jgi:hypothetical protein
MVKRKIEKESYMDGFCVPCEFCDKNCLMSKKNFFSCHNCINYYNKVSKYNLKKGGLKYEFR